MTETSEIREERQRDFEKTGRLFTKNGHQIVKCMYVIEQWGNTMRIPMPDGFKPAEW